MTICSTLLKLNRVFRLVSTPCVLIESCFEENQRLVNRSLAAQRRGQDLACQPFPHSETHPITRSISFLKIFANFASNCQNGLSTRQSSLVEQFLCFKDQDDFLL